MYRHFIFDLDGTLTDPKTGIVRCINHALKSCAMSMLDELSSDDNSHSWVVGPPLRDIFKKLAGEDAEDDLIERLVGAYRERFATVGIFENSLYPGIKNLIGSLSKNNKRKLIVATSKPTVYAKRIIEHYKLGRAFDLVIGSELDGRRSGKDELIQYVVDHYSGDDLASYLMIGDRSYDIVGAKKAGVDSVGVLYGYGTRSEIESARPNFLARSVSELGSLLTKV